MKLNFDLTYLSLPLITPIVTAKSVIHNRNIIFARIKSGNELLIGESAPLPLFGTETFEESAEVLEKFDFDPDFLFDCNFEHKLSNLLGEYFNKKPCAKNAAEMCLVKFFCRMNNLTPAEFFLKKRPAHQVSINALVSSADDSIYDKLHNLYANGFRTFKLKMGLLEKYEELQLLQILSKEYADIKLRLDYNGKFISLVDAKEYFDDFQIFNFIEYIEQPLININDFKPLSEFINLPLAADESIRSSEDASITIKNRLADVLILKPMCLGGNLETLKIIEMANNAKLKCVVSSSFETKYAKSYNYLTAFRLQPNLTCGFATNSAFRDNSYNLSTKADSALCMDDIDAED